MIENAFGIYSKHSVQHDGYVLFHAVKVNGPHAPDEMHAWVRIPVDKIVEMAKVLGEGVEGRR